ncbi:MAG: dihydroorotate dehydrogenase-like protein [Candidatus Dormiibacterota bacterium]|jgi:dihydroorotate dehydrogenase (fumarate)
MDLRTSYLGLELSNPLVASPGPLTRSVTGIRRLAAAGVGAVVLPSLFEEQIRRETERDLDLAEAGSESFGEALSYLPVPVADGRPRQYLSLIERARAAVAIPVIASLNGATSGGWADYARSMQEAGASAIELNVYYLQGDPLTPGRDVEARYLEILRTVGAAVRIPIAVKLGPYLSSVGEMAIRLHEAGAAGLVLFNRFMQNDIDPDTLTVGSDLSLSSPVEAGLPRSWIARLRGRVPISLAATTGVESARDVAAYLLAGADVVMTTSSLLRHGAEHAVELLDGLQAWMERKGFESVEQVRGRLATAAGVDPSEYGRPSYLTTIEEATRTYSPA